ncbi:uncharacterized protein LOC108411156 [Pygocentrus nattereri]|uniref:uncharacterized protein LOC108411156 n=1 Tax=Pygocentrus nattereri TaxID=42514 RepID=UPI0018918996|nr:uncharacterized protein LOC108411156 [Pygocentrus nattereri]
MSGEEDPEQMRRCIPEILDLVFRLSDGAWNTLMYVSHEVSPLQLVALSTNAVVSAARSVLQRCMQTLIGAAGAETALLDKEKLIERAESESVSLSGLSTSTDSTGPSSSTSAERSSVDQSDCICDSVEDFLREVMEKSICKFTSSKTSPLPGNWKTTNSLLAKERHILEELKDRADHSSQTPESLAVQPIRSATLRETTANHVSQRGDLTIICTRDVSGGIRRLHYPTASRAVWNIPALNAGSAMLIRSPRWTVSQIFQLHFDSCTDTVTMRVVEIHKSELLLPSSSKVSLLISIFLQTLPTVEVTTVKPQSFITEAGQASSGATGHEEGIVFEELDSAESSDETAPSASLMALDQDVQRASTSVEAQEKTSTMALSLTCRTSGEMEDPLALLVNSEQAESERINDVSVCDVTSPEVVRKRSRGCHFFAGRKAFISFGQKRESTVAPFKKTRKRLSRMFSAVCKALPNPFSCMSPPS